MKTNSIDKWKSIGETHLKADPAYQNKFKFGSAALDFLFISGMPSEFQELNFDYLKDNSIQTVNEKWDLNNSVFDKYVAIGFNGAGDPISLNQDNQELIYLNHDNDFQEVFINSDLKKFALSVVRIQEFIDQVTKLRADSFFETEFSDESIDQLVVDLKRIDTKVFEVDESHWLTTLDTIKWFREDERNR